MKHYFALFSLPSPTYEHAEIVSVIRAASKGDFKQFPVPGGVAYAYSSELKAWEISFSKILLNTDSVLIMEIGDEVSHAGFGAFGGWLNSHRPRK